MLVYRRDLLGDFDRALRSEWLETNGVGGFASSSLLGINTRRYHGLLVASLKPPVARFLLLSKYEDVLWLGGQAYPLSANLYPGAVHPRGFEWLAEVRLNPFPVFRYEVAGAVLEKRLFLVHGENTVVVEWELLRRPAADCRLAVRPLVAFRDYHATTHTNGNIDGQYKDEGGVVTIQPYAGLPAFHFATNAVALAPVNDWYKRFQYPREHERGLDAEEDLFCPVEFIFDLTPPGSVATAIASTQKRSAVFSGHLRENEERRRSTLVSPAAEQFIVRRPGATILAGYPWFTDWGRDTMISLPGLTLGTGRHDVAQSILNTFSGFVNEGMLPNRFPDSGEPAEYNTVDAALWYFEAVSLYLQATGDFAGIRERVYPALRNIVEGYRRGTRFGIHAESDGLIHSGPQLTWMDAVVDGSPVTPREGKAVEIQALWYNALCILSGLEKQFDQARDGDTAELAETTRQSFRARFWNNDAGCFFDVIEADVMNASDASIRPNQVLALSLTHPIASEEQARSVLEVVRAHLLTPYGLRTLAPSDPRFIGRYEGGPAQRDAAYHQGTVWPWLLGHYAAAAQRYGIEIGDVFGALRDYASGQGCGQIPEIFDGAAPHCPQGCIAQAWSVAEALRHAS